MQRPPVAMFVVQAMATKLVLLLALASTVICDKDGDMIAGNYKVPLASLSPKDKRHNNGTGISGHYAIVSPKRKWENGVVPWLYNPENTFTDAQKKVVETALQRISKSTCIKFKTRTTELSYVRIDNIVPGCFSDLGFVGGPQSLNLAPECYSDPTITIHEMMHALGFDHEQTRYDRDIYLEVQWDNIEPGESNNFVKYPRTRSYPRLPYDLYSVMQYYLTAFGVGGRPTMVLTSQSSGVNVEDIGSQRKISNSDVLRIRSAYKCDFKGESGGVGRAYTDSVSKVADQNFF